MKLKKKNVAIKKPYILSRLAVKSVAIDGVLEVGLMNPGFETQKYLRPSIVRGKRADFVGTIHQTAKAIPFTLFSEGMH